MNWKSCIIGIVVTQADLWIVAGLTGVLQLQQLQEVKSPGLTQVLEVVRAQWTNPLTVRVPRAQLGVRGVVHFPGLLPQPH